MERMCRKGHPKGFFGPLQEVVSTPHTPRLRKGWGWPTLGFRTHSCRWLVFWTSPNQRQIKVKLTQRIFGAQGKTQIFWLEKRKLRRNRANERLQAKAAGLAASSQTALGRQTVELWQGVSLCIFEEGRIDLNAANLLIYSLCAGHGFLLKKADIQ